jgi:hypothetical protein
MGPRTSAGWRWWVSIYLIPSKSLPDHLLKCNRDILKCRKQETRDTANSPPPIHETRPVTNHLEAPPKPQVRQPERDLPHIVSETPVRSPDPMRQYRKRWIVSRCYSRKIHAIDICSQHLEKNRRAYMKPYVDEVQDGTFRV